jgi:hypothetical protein
MRGRMVGMRFRKLRIAWSVVWGLAAALLIVLWVRSYSWFDLYSVRPLGGHEFQIDQSAGKIRILISSILDASQPVGFRSFPLTDDLIDNDQTTPVFGTWRERSIRVIHGPHWFAVMLSCAFAMLPWACSRFSLRTLLIATTLVAVVLGLIVWLLKE